MNNNEMKNFKVALSNKHETFKSLNDDNLLSEKGKGQFEQYCLCMEYFNNFINNESLFVYQINRQHEIFKSLNDDNLLSEHGMGKLEAINWCIEQLKVCEVI